MKVLQINSVCGVGSTGRIATDLYKVLEEHGHECVIAYGRENAPEGIKTIRIGSDLFVNIHGALSRITGKHGFYSAGISKKFIDHIKEYDPDVIHLHNIHGYFINIEVLFNYLKEANKPVVWTLHDCWAFTGHCAYFSYAQCDRWMNECYKCPQKKAYPASKLLDNSRRNFNIKKELFTGLENMTIVTPSQWLSDLAEKSFLSKYPIKIICNGIDTNIFKPIANNLLRNKYNLRDKFIILGVANIWNQRKGLNYFIELSGMIDDNCIIMLAGLNEGQIKELPNNIIGIKRTANIKELAQIYSAADVFVNPSVEETFGLVTAEALACGTPAIVFDSTPGVEIVADGCGYVAEMGNISAIRKLIDHVKKDGKAFYSEKCIKRVNLYFRKDERYKEYVDLYRRLC